MPSKSNLVTTYVLLVFIWASTPLAIVWSVTDLNMMWALVLRFLIALPIAFLLLVVLKIKLPCDKIAMHSYFAGSFSLIGSQIFTYAATHYLSSGIIALMFGLAPIIAGLIGRFGFQQKLHNIQWIGMLVALSGLTIICTSSGASKHVHPIGIALMFMSVFAYSISIFWVKKINAEIAPMAQATGSILLSTIAAICIIPFIWQYAPTHIPNARSLIALLYTVFIASLLAMFCYFKLVQNIKATTLSLTTVMTPLLAMLLGAMLNNEKLTISVFLGAAVLIFGVLLYFYKDFKSSRFLARKTKI
ncbi:DMT family transporter [Acinetobacter sp. ULE_I010]|uniref:DMT family transporter n=1 Tax=Acinetobacter sp. ULE_I010 TaxID=3373065 RepID=UPI003AF77146